jgi:endonuclease/exonuclease/phosphatase family metal-dependent hydrolase
LNNQIRFDLVGLDELKRILRGQFAHLFDEQHNVVEQEQVALVHARGPVFHHPYWTFIDVGPHGVVVLNKAIAVTKNRNENRIDHLPSTR